MGNSSEVQSDRHYDRGKRFVGRVKELMILDRWFDHPEAPLTIFSVTGMGGIGKSSLLSEMLSVSRNRGATSIWMDGRSCGSTPRSFWSICPRHWDWK